jgi:hypothetical protein
MDDPHDIPRPDRVLDGQPYWRAGTQPHVTRDGRNITLMVWRAFCAACGEPFTFTCTSGSFKPVRRCEAHRMPGIRVGSRTDHKRIAADLEEALDALELEDDQP